MAQRRRGLVDLRLLLVSALAAVGVVLAIWSTVQTLRGEPERRSVATSVSADGWQPLETPQDRANAQALREAAEAAESRSLLKHDFVSTKGSDGPDAAMQIAASASRAISGMVGGEGSAALGELVSPVLTAVFAGSEEDFLNVAVSSDLVSPDAAGTYSVLYAVIQSVLDAYAVAPESVRISRVDTEPGFDLPAQAGKPSLSMSVNTSRMGGPRPGEAASESDEPQTSTSTAKLSAVNTLTDPSLAASSAAYALEFPIRKKAGTDESATKHVRLIVQWLPSPGRWHLAGFEVDLASPEEIQPLMGVLRTASEARREKESG